MLYLGLKAVVVLFPEYKFEIIVYGTPAEEADRGKVEMLREGVFDEVDFCMMSHPTSYEIPVPMWLALSELQVIFKGYIYFVSV